jgi:hypothetical protein
MSLIPIPEPRYEALRTAHAASACRCRPSASSLRQLIGRAICTIAARARANFAMSHTATQLRLPMDLGIRGR